MVSRSIKKPASAVLDNPDEHADEATVTEAPTGVEEPTELQQHNVVVQADGMGAAHDQSEAGETTASESASDASPAGADESATANRSDDAPDTLVQQLEHLVRSVGVVEDLSRRAREVATTDLGLYDALVASEGQYADRLAHACAIRDQAREVHGRAFGHEARSAAEPIVAEAERVVGAFTHLASAWRERATAFLDEHPDIQLLLAERQSEQEQARQHEARVARDRRLRALIAACDEATRTGLLQEAHRLVEAVDREFPEQVATIEGLRKNVERQQRCAKDDAARQALAACAEHQARGDLEGAVGVLEQVDVHGLSVDVSQDVFGRWSDACSRLAQTAAATLLRFAPAQGRGLILYADPAYPNGLIVFSSLGMGPGFPQGKVVTDVAVLRRARPFREAAPLPSTSWAGITGASSTTTAPLGPVRH
jgi:hypothetical protein